MPFATPTSSDDGPRLLTASRRQTSASLATDLDGTYEERELLKHGTISRDQTSASTEDHLEEKLAVILK